MFVETVSAAAPLRISAVPAPAGVAFRDAQPVAAESAHPALAQCLKLHRQLEEVAPEWFDALAQHDLMLCEEPALDSLLGSAPGDFMSGYVFSWFTSRAALAMLTQNRPSAGFQGPARRAAIEQLTRESIAHDEWFSRMDLVDADTCERAELLELLETAPSPFMRGYLYGKLTVRVEIAAMTGRSY